MCWRRDPAGILAACLLSLMLVAGCSTLPTWVGGQADELVLNLDREHEAKAEIQVGKRLVLDMRDPSSKGYAFVGTLFDPLIVNLENFLTEQGRARAVFLAVKPGGTDVIVRVKRPEDKLPDTYKRVRVTVVP